MDKINTEQIIEDLDFLTQGITNMDKQIIELRKEMNLMAIRLGDIIREVTK